MSDDMVLQFRRAFRSAQLNGLQAPVERRAKSQRRGCDTKLRFRTEAEATEHLHQAQSIRAQMRAMTAETQVYFCDRHQCWHMSSKPNRKSLRGRRPLLQWRVFRMENKWAAFHVPSGHTRVFLSWGSALQYALDCLADDRRKWEQSRGVS